MLEFPVLLLASLSILKTNNVPLFSPFESVCHSLIKHERKEIYVYRAGLCMWICVEFFIASYYYKIQAMIVIIYSVAIEATPNMPLLFSVYSIQSKCFLAEIAVSDKTAYCGINCWIFPYGDQ